MVILLIGHPAIHQHIGAHREKSWCKADQEYYEALQDDLECNDERSNRYRVCVIVEHKRYIETFENPCDARVWSDLMRLLHAKIK